MKEFFAIANEESKLLANDGWTNDMALVLKFDSFDEAMPRAKEHHGFVISVKQKGVSDDPQCPLD